MTNLEQNKILSYINQLETENKLLKEKVKILLLNENKTITELTQKNNLLVALNNKLFQELAFFKLTSNK